jgi:hypothetical protein
MNEVMTAPSPVVPAERACKIEDVFDAGFIELIGLAPCNPFVRALILKLTGKMPGPECGTFEEIKEWAETHCEKKPRRPPHRTGRRNADDGISITVEFSDMEYGRASYSAPRTGSEEFRIGADDLVGMAQEAIAAGGGLDEVVGVIAGKIDDDAWNQCDPSMDNYGDYDYSDHDADDSGDRETIYSKDDIRHAVLAFARERHPELAAEL